MTLTPRSLLPLAPHPCLQPNPHFNPLLSLHLQPLLASGAMGGAGTATAAATAGAGTPAATAADKSAGGTPAPETGGTEGGASLEPEDGGEGSPPPS